MPGSIADITIVGLGPGPMEMRTVAVQRALQNARHIYLRNHPGADYSDLLGLPNVTDVSLLRDPAGAPGQRWQASALAVVDGAAEGPVVLGIPGHARFGEMLTVETVREAHARGLSVEFLDGISMIDMLGSALDLDPVRERVQLMVGREVSFLGQDAPFDGGRFAASPRFPMLITHVYTNEIMRGLAGQLLRVLPADHLVTLISEAGLPGEARETITLAELADHPGGPMLAIHVPALGELEAARDPRTLQHIVARLRRPDGCPWDRKQDHRTLRDSIIDEAYEVLDAIDSGDNANLAEELGDLLLLIMMHAQIAEEAGNFTLEDVYEGISRKIVRRHPHVFGDMSADDAGDVIGLWNQVKAQEKADRPEKPEKAADGQPHSMPALTRAPRVLQKHPLDEDLPQSTAEERSRALLTAVAAIVEAGDDPDAVLRDALINHVNNPLNNP
jgi:tetrapyrrole methylase family protein/MazG family protein